MADFPAIYADSITFDYGVPQISNFEAFGVGPILFRHTDYINRQSVELTYLNLTQSEVNQIRAHYANNAGTAGSFSVPVALFGGLGATDSNSVYRYAETPREEHQGVFFNVTVTLETTSGIELLFHLNAGSAALPAEESFSKLVFNGTSPFTLNGSTADLATLQLNAK